MKKYRLCRKCYNCKKKDEKVYCKEGYFKDKSEKDIKTLIPEDFECVDYNE